MDVETKVLNDLGEKMHRMGKMLIERPTLMISERIEYLMRLQWKRNCFQQVAIKEHWIRIGSERFDPDFQNFINRWIATQNR